MITIMLAFIKINDCKSIYFKNMFFVPVLIVNALAIPVYEVMPIKLVITVWRVIIFCSF